jgi:hypothetical protein
VTTSALVSVDAPSPEPALEAARRVLAPLARLCVARGVSWAALEELAKAALVEAARAARPDLAGRGRVSHVSAATGIHRREVARLLAAADAPAPTRVTPAAAVFARWHADGRLRDARGRPRPLPRTGPEPSFEWLARSVTASVHPRTLLDELCRLGLASLDEASDTVRLDVQAFVPRSDAAAMIGLLGANVGDHMQAAVDNVLADGRRHVEQAVFADGLSDASADAFRRAVDARWRRLATDMVPLLEGLIAEDRAAGRLRPARVRVGLYSYAEGGGPSADAVAPRTRGASSRRRLPRPDPARSARRSGRTDSGGADE